MSADASSAASTVPRASWLRQRRNEAVARNGGLEDDGVKGVGQAGRRSRTPSTRVEQDLVAAAEAVLVREGASGLTVRAVAKEAKIAPMGVYNRLGSKAGLVSVLLIRGFDRLRSALEEVEASGPLERLRECALRYRQFALDYPSFYALMFEGVVSLEGESGEVDEHATAAFRVLLRGLELAIATGRIDAPEPREAAQQLWSAVHGAVVLEMKGMVQTPDPEATYMEMVGTMLCGFDRGRGHSGREVRSGALIRWPERASAEGGGPQRASRTPCHRTSDGPAAW